MPPPHNDLDSRALLSERGRPPSRFRLWRDRIISHLPIASQHFETTELRIRIPDLPAELEGFRIFQVSDFHIYPGQDRPSHLDGVAAAMQAADPDIVVNTGDFLTEEPAMELVDTAIRELLWAGKPNLKGPSNFAILGNHDYYPGPGVAQKVVDALCRRGVAVIENKAVTLTRNGAPVTIAGVTVYRPGFEDVIERISEMPRPRIGLIHEPDLVERVPSGLFDLVLSGHTHGGQVALPLLERYIVRRYCGSNYVAGMYRINGNRVWVNRGLGNSGVPFRFRAAPEATVVQLSR